MKKAFKSIKRHHVHRVVDVGDFLLTAAVVLLAFATVISGYGGYVNPSVIPAAALVAMMFPVFMLLSVATLVALIIVRRRLALVPVVSILLSLPSLLVYCPLNFGHAPSEKEASRSFKVMTYNALNWTDYSYEGLDTVTPNASVQLVLDADPDILCLQECSGPTLHTPGVTPGLLDEFFKRYPYVERVPTSSLTIYSKFPITRLVDNDRFSETADYACYRLNVRGRLLTLYNVHLQSIGLSPEDKALYREITDGRTEVGEINRVRDNIFSKLYAAFINRSRQAQSLRSFVDNRKGDIIVCGDFNDIPGCYAVREVKGSDMSDAFYDAGTGPSVSYRAGRFYFRIDHMLYRGDFHAINSQRIRGGLSDHYPIITTFVWDEPSKLETDRMKSSNNNTLNNK